MGPCSFAKETAPQEHTENAGPCSPWRKGLARPPSLSSGSARVCLGFGAGAHLARWGPLRRITEAFTAVRRAGLDLKSALSAALLHHIWSSFRLPGKFVFRGTPTSLRPPSTPSLDEYH